MTATTKDRALANAHEGDEAGRCGGCGSRNLMLADMPDSEVEHGICLDCGRLQEVEPREWPLSIMCDNCAFRKGSPERADPHRWAEILDTLDEEQPFHCHKGLPMSEPDGGGHVQFEAPDASKGRVKICAGWFAMLAHRYNNRSPKKGTNANG